MNDGKICVSVCAETADQLFEQIKRAAESADVIEIRFDCLENDSRIKDVLQEIPIWKKQIGKPILFTHRPAEQGGQKALDENKRKDFWSWRDDGGGSFGGKVGLYADLIDVEADLLEDFDWSVRFKNRFNLAKLSEFSDSFEEIQVESYMDETIISSHHDFVGVPSEINQIYKKLASSNADVIKIAVQADDITDSIPLWKILEKAKADNKPFIPIAMGESGKWTRILGLAHGAFMTYAALETGSETAPGQVSAKDLIEIYRAKELNETTAVYGILGSNTSVSMSPYIHNTAFQYHELNSVFVPLQVHDLDAFMRRMVKPETREIDLNFRGFSVTLPHKQAIIKHLDFLDETAEKIGAVNTVKIVDGAFYGYNTDAPGFIAPLLDAYGDLKNARVAVLGAGGAARACIYALKTAGAKVTVFARDLIKAKTLADEFEVELRELATNNEQRTTYKDFDILVNTTPLGMKGKAEGETPASAEQLNGLKLVYDLVYIPFQTPLMAEAERAGVPNIGGLAMLIAQALEQQKIWTGLDAPMAEMKAAALKRLS